MWALVESDTIQEIFNDPKALSIGDVQYPKNIFSLWSAEELQAIGIYPVEINSSNYKNVNYYNNAEISYSFDSENNKVVGSYGTATAKALDDTLWTSDDDPLPAGTSVGDIKDIGLKNQHKESINSKAGQLLKDTDWMVIREADGGTAVPSNVTTYRAAIRTKANEHTTAIDGVSDVDALAALEYDWPTLGS